MEVLKINRAKDSQALRLEEVVLQINLLIDNQQMDEFKHKQPVVQRQAKQRLSRLKNLKRMNFLCFNKLLQESQAPEVKRENLKLEALEIR